MCATNRLVSSFLATHAKHLGIGNHNSNIFSFVFIFEFVDGLCSKYNYIWWDSTGFSLVIHQGCLHNVQVRICLYFVYNKVNYKGNTSNFHLWNSSMCFGSKFEFAATMELERWYKCIYGRHLYFNKWYYKSFIFELDLSMFIVY